MNRVSQRLCRKEKKRRKCSAFSCLQSIFYHPHPVKLTFPSELLLSDCPSLPHLLPVCPGLVILSHFQLPSLLSLLLFSTGHRFSLLFFCHSPPPPLFAADAHSNQPLSVFTSVPPPPPLFLPSARDFPPQGVGGRQVFCQPANGMKRAHQHVFFSQAGR